MRSINRFESNLVRILHSFLGHTSVQHVLPALKRPMERPSCLSRDAVELVQQSLANGTVMLLARRGGWLQQRHLRGDQIREGSLWQRSKPEELGLTFSAASLDFLIWLTATNIELETDFWEPPSGGPLTLGDQFLLHRAARALGDSQHTHPWYASDVFRDNTLIALTQPQQFAVAEVVPQPDFDPWLTGIGGCVLEAMQDDLAESWNAVEQDKRRISNNDLMLQLGRVQEEVLNRLFDAAEKHGRRDLCRFLLQALHQVVGPRSERDHWVALLRTDELRLAQRTELYESASAFLRSASRLRHWHTRSLGVGYFDEGYAESQLYKSLWESTSAEESFGHADRVIGELSSF